MTNFEIISPGKIILHGEHAVVYARPAIAAVVGLATKLRYRDQPETQIVSIKLETLDSNLEIDLKQFNDFLDKLRLKCSSIFPQYPELECTAQLLEEVRQQVAHIRNAASASSSSSPQQQHIQRAYLAIYYLLAGAMLSSPQRNQRLQHGFELQIDSELAMGAGLGSSASFGAALAAAFLIHAEHFNLQNYAQPQYLKLISEWAYESERVMHGTPSGVDNTVCTYGGMLLFRKNDGFRTLSMQAPINVLLVDSRVKRSTADVIAKLRHLSATFPRIVEQIWNVCEELVNEAIPLYTSFGNGQDDSEKFEKMERLFQINNDLLKAVGATHPKLEQIFAIAFKRGFFSKITGAGSGGYAILLLPKNYADNPVYSKLKEELIAAGFGVQATTAGGCGLQVLALKD